MQLAYALFVNLTARVIDLFTLENIANDYQVELIILSKIIVND